MNKVGIHCITYNHEKYIEDALKSFVNQRTQFEFKVYISDDASTDATQEIIKEYAAKYPDIIAPIFHKKNIGSFENFIFNFKRIKAEYVCICDGDDYWIDNDKLQKQVDFMDKNQDCSICFSPTKVIFEDKSSEDFIYPDQKFFQKDFLSLADLLEVNFIQTNSVMYRWRFNKEELQFPTGIQPADWYMHLLHAESGKIGFITDVTSVYRRWGGSIWTKAGTPEWAKKYALPHARFFKALEKKYGVDKHEEIRQLYYLYLIGKYPYLGKILTFLKRKLRNLCTKGG